MFDIFSRFPEMKPINRAPSLQTVNGIGTMAYGSRDPDPETGTYVKTVWFTLVFIPILPLASYRVANSQGGGWIFIGRVPVSGVARGWTLFLLLAIAGSIGFGMWSHHTGTPSYAASQKLAQAERLRADGKLNDAALLCRDVLDSKTDQAPRAMQMLTDMLKDPALQEKADGKEMAGVFRVAVEVRDWPGAIQDLFPLGLRFAEARAADNPEGSLAVLETVEPIATDLKTALPLREKILLQLTKQRPNDVELLSKLAVTYERGNQRPRCLALLEPHAPQLGTTEGARILGLLLFEKGKHEQAFALLQPYADKHLDSLKEADQQYQNVVRFAQNELIDNLKTGKAKDFDFAQYKRSTRAEQDTQVNEYLAKHLRANPEVTRKRQALVRLGVVVPVALDLGMMRLGRAQRMPNPAARKAELELAEKTFLAVRGLAGDQVEYRLSLGQVYFWLGKQEQGRKLFEEALKFDGRSFNTLVQVASLLRQLGDMNEARNLAEEAYKQEGDLSKRQGAAMLRALTNKDNDDAITWLERANQALPEVKAYLAESRGHKAFSAGKDEEAAEFYREAAAIYAAQPESPATLNNGSIAYQALYRASGDKSALEKSVQMQEKAITLKQSDGILVGNVAPMLLATAVAELAAERIDYTTLRLVAEWSDLHYLYANLAGRSALQQRTKGHATVQRARSYFDRALLLAPNNSGLYPQYQGLLHFLGEASALQTLSQRAAEAKLDFANARRDRLDFWQGKRDAKWLPETTASAARAERRLPEARKKGGATFAVAVGVLLRTRLVQETLGLPFDTTELVKLTEEAHQLAPSVGTLTNLRTALLVRASKTLAEQEPAYAQMVKRAGRSMSSSYLMAVAVWREGPAQKAALANADVKRAISLIRDYATQFPNDPSEWTWVLLKPVHPEEAAPMAVVLKTNELELQRRALEARLVMEGDPTAAFRRIWLMEATAVAGDSQEILRRCAAEGGLFPIEVP